MNPQTQDQIDVFCNKGDDHLNAGDFDDALVAFQNAADLIPNPKENWPQSTWIFTAIGETYFFKEDYINALENLKIVVTCPDGLGNPLVHFRLGQVYYELYHFDKAADEFTRAYMGAGKDIFQHDNPKYFHFLKSKIIIRDNE